MVSNSITTHAHIIQSMLIKCIQTAYRKLTNPQAKFTVVIVCTIILFILVGSTYVISSTVFADTSGSLEEFNFGIALPGEKCRVDSLPDWTQVEKSAWKNICENEVVNFNVYLNENLDPTNRDHDDRWADGRRTLSASFLNTILLYEPFRSAIPSRGVRIGAAYIQGEFDLIDAVLERPLALVNSIFSSRVDMDRLTTPTLVAFVGSRFDGKLSMASASIGGSLLMSTDAKFNNVNLGAATISNNIQIVGSTFNGELDMNGISVRGSLHMGKSAGYANVVLVGAIIDGQLSMVGSTFNGELDMNGISVGGSLLMRKSTGYAKVVLVGAIIDGQLSMVGSTFNGELNMNAITVGSSLLMTNDAKFNNVFLRGANIEGDLYMFGSTFTGGLDMDLLSVGGSLFMNNAIFKNVKLAGAKIENIVDMRGANFKGQLDMNSTLIGSSLIMSYAKFENMTNLTFLSVGSNLEIQGAVLRKLNLTGAQIERTLRLSKFGESNIEWKNYELEDETLQSPKLTLKNAKVGVLQDTKNSWPDHLELELEGFTFNHLAGPGLNGQEMPHQRGSDWFIDWLKADETYSPQPYRQLAGVLRTAGLEEMANDILFASRERMWRESSPLEPKWWNLFVLKIFIGYGYGGRIFWALAWIVGIVAVGTWVLHISKERGKHSILQDRRVDCACYSLDMILPLIHLRERHYKDVDLITWAKYYFYIHKIMGYILVFFVIAGLSGLTR